MHVQFARWVLVAAIGCAHAGEDVAITGVAKSFGEPVTVTLTHPVIVAERVVLQREASVAVRRGAVNQTCADASFGGPITGASALHADCFVEIMPGTACTIDVDGVSRSFELRADGESAWLKLERQPR